MIYVITAVHNRIKVTKRFIECLKNQTIEERVHLILIDDGSTDNTDKMVVESFKESTVLYGDGNLYWGGALHKAYKHLMQLKLNDDDIIFYVNDDSTLPSDYLKKVSEFLGENPNSLLTGCGYGIKTGNYLDGPVWFDLRNGEVKHLSAGETGNCASTRALCMYAKVFKKIGGFHPVLLPHYASDYEYTIRANKKGYPIKSSKEICYMFSEDTTGDNLHKNISLKRILSKRSKLNPLYKLTFILLIAPIYRLPAYVIYQIKNFKKHERDAGKSV